jgi:hypothetical protein
MATSVRAIGKLLDALRLQRGESQQSISKSGIGISSNELNSTCVTLSEGLKKSEKTLPLETTSPNWKETNPKDLVGQSKLPLDLVPDTIEVEVSLAYLEGALKYGRYNWRISGVRSSIYRSALRRHLAKWWNGEDRDQVTRVKHLASIIACAGILLDAELCDKLTDDRPPRAPIGRIIDVEPHIEHLKQLFKKYSPKQYTIHDGVEPDANTE